MKSILFYILLAVCSLAAAAQEPYTPKTKQLLDELDGVIARKDDIRRGIDRELTRTKAQARRATGATQVELYKHAFATYAHMQTDSARQCLDCLGRLAAAGGDAALRTFVDIGHAEILALAGQYSEAIERLLAVAVPEAEEHHDLQLLYYHKLRTIYGWMADYAVDEASGRRWRNLMNQYRDSILSIELNPAHRNIVLADKELSLGHARQALDISLRNATLAPAELQCYNSYNLAQAYRQLGNSDLYIYHLAQTAMADLKAGVAEYEALPELAQALFDIGEVKRSYDYLICAMEDANLCKARLRAIETSNVFPIFDKAYKEQERGERRRIKALAYVLLTLVVALVAGLVWLFRVMRQRAAVRRKLSEANLRLHETNDALTLTNKMKEEYIARYLNRCRDYLDKLEDYRNGILKLVKARRTEELQKRLSSETFAGKERAAFYSDFDEAFLKLFPNFIGDFNALLEPDAAIVPRGKELLCTELRIFALVRLGVTESAKIAHFLNCSLATIYNYRSKVRNHALCDKAEFEKRVMEI